MEILGLLLIALLCLPIYAPALLDVIRAIGEAIAVARFGECDCDDGDGGEEDEVDDTVPPPPATKDAPTVHIN